MTVVRIIKRGVQPYSEGDRVVNAYARHPAYRENTLGVLSGERLHLPVGIIGQVYQVIGDRVLVVYRGAVRDGGPLWAWYWPENLSPEEAHSEHPDNAAKARAVQQAG